MGGNRVYVMQVAGVGVAEVYEGRWAGARGSREPRQVRSSSVVYETSLCGGGPPCAVRAAESQWPIQAAARCR